jgi:hypothetical protein
VRLNTSALVVRVEGGQKLVDLVSDDYKYTIAVDAIFISIGRSPDHRSCQGTRPDHRVKRREYLPIRQVTGNAEQNERVRLRRIGTRSGRRIAHVDSLPVFSRWPPNSCRIADKSWLEKSDWPREVVGPAKPREPA